MCTRKNKNTYIYRKKTKKMGTKFYSRWMGAKTFDSTTRRLFSRNETIEIKQSTYLLTFGKFANVIYFNKLNCCS